MSLSRHYPIHYDSIMTSLDALRAIDAPPLMTPLDFLPSHCSTQSHLIANIVDMSSHRDLKT